MPAPASGPDGPPRGGQPGPDPAGRPEPGGAAVADDAEDQAGEGQPAEAASAGQAPGLTSRVVSARTVRPGRAIVAAGVGRGGAVVGLAAAMVAGVCVGPAALSLPTVLDALLARLPGHLAAGVPPLDSAIVWQIRLPRVVLGALVGSMLAGGGAAYQGVFRNPLAAPYLLGAAAGGGLGATIVIVAGGSASLLPPAAFAGALGAVALTYLLGASGGPAGARGGAAPGVGGSTASILLAGIAVAAMLTAIQTYLQQQHTSTLQGVYAWILGGLSLASWPDVTLIIPYVAVCAVALLAHRRLLDVLRVGEAEAASLGVHVGRLRLTVVIAATLGVAAAVAVSGLIGFVGIIVPHIVRLTAGPSYRVLLPVSIIGGAAFLVLA